MQQVIINAVGSAVAIVALAAAVWAVVTGQFETQGIDSLFLIAFCLVAAGLFAWIPVQALRRLKARNAPADETRKAVPAATTEPPERA